jgi:hypothetical protein
LIGIIEEDATFRKKQPPHPSAAFLSCMTFPSGHFNARTLCPFLQGAFKRGQEIERELCT